MAKPAQTGMKCPFNVYLTLLALFFTLNANAGSDQDAKQLLERMIQAVHNLDYQGTFIHLHDNQLETMKIVHAFKDGKLQERLISLNGAPREVIRDHESVTCVAPDAEKLSIDKRPLSGQFFAMLPDELNQLMTITSSNYWAKVGWQDERQRWSRSFPKTVTAMATVSLWTRSVRSP
jgi:sigma-E factor negative regulatory protein RseB